MNILLAVLAMFLTTGMASPVPAQTVDKTINVVDPVLKPTGTHVIARHYLLYDGRPNCPPGQTARLIVAIHGGHGSAETMATEYLTPQGCYVIAYPSGSNKVLGQIRVSGNNLSWNTSSPYESGQGWAGENGVKDDLFLTSLVGKLKTDYGLTKAFAVGVSRGGMMGFHLACDTTLFSAIASVATTIAEPILSCPGTHIPNLHIHGTADDLVCWTADTCSPWPKAQPRIAWWQNSGTGHQTYLHSGGHIMPPEGPGKIFAFLDTIP